MMIKLHDLTLLRIYQLNVLEIFIKESVQQD